MEEREMDDLQRLADTANAEHKLAAEAARTGLLHAIECGEALNRACELVPYGQWQAWVDQNMEFSQMTASKYRRLAFYREMVENEDLSIENAYVLLGGLPKIADPSRPFKLSPALVRKMRKLREDGVTFREIGEQFGISHGTVVRYLDPASRDRYRESLRRSQRRLRAARAALREKEERQQRDALARQAGGRMAHAYAQIRKTALALDVALGGSVGAQHEAIRRAIAHVHHAEDEIVQTLRQERAAS